MNTEINSIDTSNKQPIDLIWFYKKSIFYISESAKKRIGFKDAQNKKQNNLDQLFNKASCDKLQKSYSQIAESKKKQVKLILELNKNQSKIEVTLSSINFQRKKLVQLLIHPNNTQNNKDLYYKRQQIQTLLETSNHLVWMVNKKNQLTEFNSIFKKLILQKYKIKIKKGTNIGALIKKNAAGYANYWHPKHEQVFNGASLVFIKEDFIEKKVYRQIFMNPIPNDENPIQELCCIAHDITDTILYEKKVNNQNGRLNAIFDSSQHYIWTIDKNDKLTSFNKNYFDLVTNSYSTQPYLGLTLNRGTLAYDKNYVNTLTKNYKKAFNGEATSFELETQDQENKSIYLEVFLNPIFEKNKVVEVSGIAHNITEKRAVRQKMEISLKEKEVLLREVHHRVKNNMQVISSILNLQSYYVKDEYALGLLKESQNRISTMAYIHESLYQNSSFSSVNFSEYVKKLIKNIITSYTFSVEKVEMNLEIQEIILSLDNSIPLGLIINELITNSIKHAFPNVEKGTVSLKLKSENNFVFLDLMDDGIGLKENFNIENSESLGLQLVNTLIEQIGAKYIITSKKGQGTKFNISFQIQ